MSIDTTRSAVTRRIEALLAKAASTTFGDEAEAHIDKAQQLMARHAIDEAMLRRSSPGTSGDVIVRVVLAERPYASARSALLIAIARNNHCRLVLHGTDQHGTRCTLFGHAADVSHVASLFGVLTLHATRAMFATDPGLRPKRYRHALLFAYAMRIGERLWDANEEARREAERASSSPVALALVERWAEVDRVVRREFPFLSRRRRQATSSAGLTGGRAAADLAPIGLRSVSGGRGLPRGAR